MNSNLFSNLWRFLLLVAVQVLFLKQVSVNAGAYFNVLLYPLFVLLLPVRLGVPYLVLLGFTVGMTVDYFYVSYGLHASAAAFSGFAGASFSKYSSQKAAFRAKNQSSLPTISAGPFLRRRHLCFSLSIFSGIFRWTISPLLFQRHCVKNHRFLGTNDDLCSVLWFPVQSEAIKIKYEL